MTDVIVADPPWQFGDRLPGKGRGASKHYRTMTEEQIASFDLPAVGSNAVLFLWRVAAMQREALCVMDAWGFDLKSEMCWKKLTATGKDHFGMGRYVRASHEICLIGVRGLAFPAVRNVRSTFTGSVRAHSEKPDEFYSIVELMYPESRKIELFARRTRPGWEQYGDELGIRKG